MLFTPKSYPPIALGPNGKHSGTHAAATVAVHSLDKTITDNNGNEVLLTVPNQDIPFNEVGSAVHITGVNGIILRL